MSPLADLVPESADGAVPIHVSNGDGLEALGSALGGPAAAWIAAADFRAKPGTHLLVPGDDGRLAAVIAGAPAKGDPFAPLAWGALAGALPAGDYRPAEPVARADQAALGWLLGSYRFDRYRPSGSDREPARLVVPGGGERDEALRVARGCHLAMDLINTPTNDLGPAALGEAAKALGAQYGGDVRETVGDDLLGANLPLIHAVGRAAAEAPRLVDFTWGDPGAPKVTLVGKGVTFDTGGLDLKPPAAMLLMKKDMGGAANVLGLASMVMDGGLPVRLRVLVPIVENAVSGPSFRPGDVLTSRKGTTVEIGNTDAEGRLILADALALADEEAPDLVVDMATLTGAARVALGPDLPPFYTGDDALAAAVAEHGMAEADPVWRLPLWPPYDDWLAGKVGNITNAPEKPFAGSITAALFLARFVEQAAAHLHFDIYAWTPDARPHAPRGGAAQAIRALYALLRSRYRA